MISCKRRATLSCDISDAFEYVADWHNYNSFLPMFSNIEPTSVVHYGPGASFDATITVAKAEVRTTLDVAEFQKNRKLTIKASKGIRMKTSWEFKDIGGKVLITFDFEYDLPLGLTFRADQKEALEKELQETACKSMELLRWVLESGGANSERAGY
jgi:ribosome-associated toxin RatA of RatAB toxin-antitoxin module